MPRTTRRTETEVADDFVEHGEIITLGRLWARSLISDQEYLEQSRMIRDALANDAVEVEYDSDDFGPEAA